MGRRWPPARGTRALRGAVAWLTLEAADNDPVRFWTYVAMAVERVRGGLGRGALQRLKTPGHSLEGAVIELTNGIAAFGAPLTVVLDDFQSITDRECLDSIDYVLDHLPPTTRLMVITRSDPSLNLARLRASAALAEVRADDLALTSEEATDLLVGRGGLVLGPDEVEVLLERTQGWPGALYLALLWLRGVENPARRGARVRRRSSIRRRIPEPRGPQLARRGVALVPVARVGPPSLHRRAL